VNFPDKKYNIIYADPAWSYQDKALNRGGAERHYITQDINWIANLPVKEISADDCILFIWVTMPKLNEVFQVIEQWGFTYKTCAFTWVKLNKKSPTLFWGMGRWTRSNSELCLLATKGNPKRLSASVHSVIQSPIMEHSRKPAEIRDKIVELVGDLPRVELFARQKSNGWDAWGNELE